MAQEEKVEKERTHKLLNDCLEQLITPAKWFAWMYVAVFAITKIIPIITGFFPKV